MAQQIRKANKTLENQYKVQGSRCYYCTNPFPFEHITKDHVEAKSKGSKLPGNKVFACFKCNQTKGNKEIDEYRKQTIKEIIKILRKVVARNWKISNKQLDEMRYYSNVLKTLTKLQANDNKPEFKFN